MPTRQLAVFLRPMVSLCLGITLALSCHPAIGQEPVPAPPQAATPPQEPTAEVAEVPDSGVADTGDRDCGKATPFEIFSSVKGAKHPTVEGDYLVLIYDANKHLTSWYDYSRAKGQVVKITRNASFVPVVYSREKIAVHVCGLHFTDALTVTTNPIGISENGADIRGITPPTTPAPALAATVDTFPGSQNTGASVQPGNLGFGSTQPLSSLTVAGFTPGVVSLSTNTKALYADATITISPEQLALMMIAFVRNAESVKPAIDQIEAGTQAQEGERGHPENRFAFAGSINSVQNIAGKLLKELIAKGNPSKEMNQHPDEFNSYIYRVQSLVAQMGGVNGTLSSASLGARALTLRQNYATIRGVLNLVGDVVETDRDLISSHDCSRKSGDPDVDSPECRLFELHTFERFLRDYCRALPVDPQQCMDFGEDQEDALFRNIRQLHDALEKVDETVAKIFAIVNKWYELSNVEETDLLTPSTTNALERINIIVQRTFVPFTFAASSSPGPAVAPSGGGGGAAAGSGGTGGASSASGPGSGGASPAAPSTTPMAESVLVEVHRKANFNLVGGVMAIHVPSKTFGVLPQTAALTGQGTAASPYAYPAFCNGGPPINLSVTPNNGQPQSAPYYCVATTQTGNWQVAAMAGIAWFPAGRDYFPRGSGGSFRVKNLVPSLLVASSVTSLGSVFLGPDFEPLNGLDLFAGVASAHQIGLPSSFPMTSVLQPSGGSNAAPSLPTTTRVKWGLSLGIGFDLSVFTQIFSKTSSPTLP